MTRRELLATLLLTPLLRRQVEAQARGGGQAPGGLTAPEPPRMRPDTTLKASGKVSTATPGTLQGLMDSAGPGDRITCDPSTPWVGNWRVNRPVGQPPITITSSRDDKPVRFLTTTPQPVFRAVGSVGGVRWENVEITLDPKVNYTGGQSLVQLGENERYGQHPRGFGFRKSRIFGNPGQDVRRGIQTNCGDFFFLDGRIEEIHQRGSDSQAICGWNAGEGHLVRNAFLEAATENIMYGGAGNNGSEMNPRDITIENVTLSKRKEWDPSSPTFAGIRWNIKNHLEFKIGQRVRVNGLHCINCFTDGQVGRSIVITPRDVPGRPWIVTQDIDIQNVLIEDVNSAFVLLGHDDAAGPNQPVETATARIRFSNWLARINRGGKCFDITADNYDVELDRMTWVAAGPLYATVIMAGLLTRLKASNLVLAHGEHGWAGASGEGTHVRHLFPNPVMWHQIMDVGPGARPLSDGPGNNSLPGPLEALEDPAAIFMDPARGDYRSKGIYAGRGADLDAIRVALTPAQSSLRN